ncbi:MAG: protoporphyrinogen/coproporphyrinogen oxidase [Aeromicrobium sp.]
MRVAIVGGGIAGLAAAHFLAATGREVVVLESSDRVGGKLRRERVGDVTLDVGAEAILARRPEGRELISQVRALSGSQVDAATTKASVWTGGALRPLPRTVMGIPAEPTDLVHVEPHELPIPGGDISVAQYVIERAGRDVLDRLVEPLLGGVYAGRAEELSLAAAAPQLLALGSDPVSAASAVAPSDETLFIGLDGGVGRLPEEIVADGIDVETSTTVRGVERENSRWLVRTTHGDRFFDGVIVATPAPAASRLLAEVAPAASFALADIQYASVAIATFIFDRDLDLEGSGFLVPPVEGTSIKGATFSSNKWGWLAEPGRTVLRASLGRYGDAATLQYDDATLAQLALADLREILGPLPDPAAWHVQRWGGGLPQYTVGHLDRVATITAAIGLLAGMEVCGAAYSGIGIPAVIASAQGAVEGLLKDLGN